MNTTTYKNRIPSPFQAKAFVRKDPLREEVEKNIGTFTISVTVEEDTQTLSSFKHIPGYIAYICTLKKGNEVIGVGRGTAILNRINKFVERTIRSAFCGSLIDAMVRSVKTLDALYLQAGNQKNAGVLDEETNEISYVSNLATDKQKSFLRELIHANMQDEKERSQWESQIEELTKDEASEKIQFFMRE